MKDFFKKLSRKFNPWYILEVTHRGRERRMIVKEFKKKTPKHISGINVNDEFFELRSEEPMDYYVEEYKADIE